MIFTKYINGRIFISFLFICALLTSCIDKERRPEPNFKEEYVENAIETPEGEADILEVVQGVTEISHFAMELGASDFPEIALGENNFTVFAPVNDKFPPREESSLNNSSAEINRSEIIEYHISKDHFTVEELRQITLSDSLPYINTADGEKIFLSIEEDNIILTGSSGQKAKIIRSLSASNGMVHIIDNSLLPE